MALTLKELHFGMNMARGKYYLSLLMYLLVIAPLSAQLTNPGGQNTPVVQTYKPGFVEIFGARPFGPRDRDMVRAQQIWDARHEKFDRLVDESFPVSVFLLYEEIGLGLPVAWKQTDGRVYVAFPEARYFKTVFQSVSNVHDFPGVVWRTWHLDSVSKGFCVPELNRNFPGVVLSQNTVNCSVED